MTFTDHLRPFYTELIFTCISYLDSALFNHNNINLNNFLAPLVLIFYNAIELPLSVQP